MTKTRVVHCLKDAFDVRIARPGIWGNPFIIGRDGTREEVIQKYREWIIKQADLMKLLPMLDGKRLGCYCKPDACHGDVLVELLDGMITNELLQ